MQLALICKTRFIGLTTTAAVKEGQRNADHLEEAGDDRP